MIISSSRVFGVGVRYIQFPSQTGNRPLPFQDSTLPYLSAFPPKVTLTDTTRSCYGCQPSQLEDKQKMSARILEFRKLNAKIQLILN